MELVLSLCFHQLAGRKVLLGNCCVVVIILLVRQEFTVTDAYRTEASYWQFLIYKELE